MVYDLLFFFIVIIIVLNLIFGVIIDTFADLRSEKQKKEEILKTTCFICGEAWFLSHRGYGRAGAACGLGHHLGQWRPQFGPFPDLCSHKETLLWDRLLDGRLLIPEMGTIGPCLNSE